MKKIEAVAVALFLTLSLPFAALAQEAGQWGIGLRAGPSFLTQTWGHLTVTDTDGSTPGTGSLKARTTGPMVSGKISHVLNDYFSAGLNVEWDVHKVPVKKLCLDCKSQSNETFTLGGGRFNTMSLMPFVEIRPMRFGGFSPYLAAAAGMNMNWLDWQFADVARTTNTFGIKAGGGFDYFLTKNLAFNSEVGWKWNRGGLRYGGVAFDAGTPEGALAKGNSRGNTVSLLFGLRYYFPQAAGGVVEKIVERERVVEKPVERLVEKEVIKEVPVEKIVRVPEYITVERIVFSDIAFDYDKSTLTDLGKGRVYLIAQKLKDNKNIKVVVEGHTDFIGTDEYNQALGLRRANAVREELVRLGISADRMTTASYGESQPLLDMQTDWARAVNRRVEFEISGDVPKGATTK